MVVVGGAGNSAVRESGDVDIEVRGVSGRECCENTGLRSRERRLLLLLLFMLLLPELRKERPKRRDAKLGRVGGEVANGGVR